jgi:hypothetical protein
VIEIGGGGSGACIELTAIQANATTAGAPFNGAATFQ